MELLLQNSYSVHERIRMSITIPFIPHEHLSFTMMPPSSCLFTPQRFNLELLIRVNVLFFKAVQFECVATNPVCCRDSVTERLV